MTAEWRERMERIRLGSVEELFGCAKPVIGMVHLWPLPGAPGYTGYGMDRVRERAVADARALAAGGVNGIIVENMWDLPYYVGSAVPPETVTCQAVAARAVVEEVDVPVGINVVHNGGIGTLAIALAAGAQFIRVCLLTGAQVWDTGELDHGCAGALMRKRKELAAENIKILADVDKKHAVRFPGIDLATHIEWTEFYGADILIVSGAMTGSPPTLDKVRRACELATRPVFLGSGTSEDNVSRFLELADGAIVGSSLKEGGDPTAPVDPARVRQYVQAAHGAG